MHLASGPFFICREGIEAYPQAFDVTGTIAKSLGVFSAGTEKPASSAQFNTITKSAGEESPR